MILVTRLDRQSMLLNPDHIISIEETPDTVITLFNGNHVLVREPAQVLLNRIVAFRSGILRRSAPVPGGCSYLRRRRNLQYQQAVSPSTPLSFSRGPAQQMPLHRQDI